MSRSTTNFSKEFVEVPKLRAQYERVHIGVGRRRRTGGVEPVSFTIAKGTIHIMKLLFGAISTGSGVLAAVAMKSVIGKLWPDDPPKNPADRSVTWRDAVTWALVSSVGAGVARLVARRAAAAGWEKATGETAPGLA